MKVAAAFFSGLLELLAWGIVFVAIVCVVGAIVLSTMPPVHV